MTDADALFAAPAKETPAAEDVTNPRYRAMIEDMPSPWSSEQMPNLDDVSPHQLVRFFLSLKHHADIYSMAAGDLSKAASMIEPLIVEIIAERKGMAIPAYIGVTEYEIGHQKNQKLKLSGKKPAIIKALSESKHEALNNIVQAKPDYNYQSLMKFVRDELKDAGIDPDNWTPESVSDVLAPELGQFVEVETTSTLTFKEQK